MGIENFIAFMFTALFFVMTPGIDTVFVLNKSVSQGRRAGFFASLGVNSGVLVHTFFAALGLSILVAKSALAFSMVKYLGAAYLIYLGITSLMTKKTKALGSAVSIVKPTSRQNYVSGLITNTFNPKVALFFLAFFPQFINPNELENPIPFILLGITYAAIGTLWFLTLTFFSGSFSRKIMTHPKANRWMDKISGIVFILMGLKIAISKN